ncbi:MAG: polysaccharide pyruvyl transferase family protein [Candidatus Omnitrophica bacterium]|nr:polysaccharide pyruvyl transferase family protein [Candidatus Omnitrophota bacterium]
MKKRAVILNDTFFEMEHGCRLVMKNIRYLLHKKNIDVIDTNPVGVNWECNTRFIRNVRKSDIVIVNGEGTIHHNQKEGLYLVKVSEYCKKLNIPVVLINAVYHANNEECAGYMKNFDLIFVRESLSKRELDRLGVNSEIVPDMTLFSDAKDAPQRRRSDRIGFTDSAYIHLSQKMYNYSKRSKRFVYLPLVRPYRLEGVFNPMKLFQKIKYEGRNAMTFLQNRVLGYALDHAYERRLYYVNSWKDYIEIVGNLRMLITARFHALCFALTTETPFLALSSNSHKIEGIMQDIGLNNNRLVNFESLNERMISQYDSFSDDELSKVSDYTQSAVKKIEKMFDKIKGIS